MPIKWHSTEIKPILSDAERRELHSHAEHGNEDWGDLEMHSEYLNALKSKAESDSRVKAVWLEGSFGKGSADRYSDIDAHLLIHEAYIGDFRRDVESWLSDIRPLVLFRAMFDGQMLNCLTEDGLRVDMWLHAGDSISLGGKQILLLFDRGGCINTEETDDRDRQKVDIRAALQRHIAEFWRCVSILPAVLGRNELITGFMGVAVELTPLTEVRMIGSGAVRDAGVKTLNRFLPPDAKLEIENAIRMEGVTQESLARAHLRLAGIMQRRGPAIAQQYEISYPFDLERAVIRYVSKELQLLGLESCLEELQREDKAG